jgi:hypothetical protein
VLNRICFCGYDAFTMNIFLTNVFWTRCSSHYIGYCCGMISYKASPALQPFSNLLWVPIWVLIIPDSSNRALWQIRGETPRWESGETWGEIVVNLPTKYIFHTPQGSLARCKIIQHGSDGFTSPPKEVVLRIFIACNSLSSSAGFETANLRSNGKHDNH